MTNLQFCARRGWLLAVFAGICAICLLGSALTAQERKDGPPKRAHVFVHADKLTGKDKLTDGTVGKAIEIRSETTLIWVDLMPDFRFSHETQYVLISAEGTRVVNGQWRPVLNGKELFNQSTKPYKVDRPVNLGLQ
jgi:hypothetical protein